MPELAERYEEAAPLLGPDEAPPFERLNPGGSAKFLLVCDHASRRIPRALGTLGLEADDLGRHIAWDIGAAEVTRRLSARLDAPAVMAGYSRLVIDLNRALDDPTSIPVISDGIIVPGNRGVVGEAAEARARALFHPYHGAVAEALAAFQNRGHAPALVSIHSFTPVARDGTRPWHIGVLWDRDPRMAVPFMQKMTQGWDLSVGDNAPYSGRDHYTFTVDYHAERTGLPHLAMEIRHDLIADADGADRWAERIGDVLADILADSALYRVEHFG